jgi:hypothetical protein
VIAHLFKGFAIFVLFPCKKQYVELQCIYIASVPPDFVTHYKTKLHHFVTVCEKFRCSIVRECRFRPRFFMSNGSDSLFSRCPKFEMAAFVLKS